MNKRRLLIRIIVSPFVLMIIFIAYMFGFIKHFIKYMRWGGEWITYDKNEPENIKEILEMLKKSKE